MIWPKEQVCFEPVHYLALLERKPGALDFARPLEGWEPPESFGLPRRRLEADHGSAGTKEYIAVLRLLHPLARLQQAVSSALELGCPRKEQWMASQTSDQDRLRFHGLITLRALSGEASPLNALNVSSPGL